jgi:serine/threonine-protein kinase Chk1
VLRRRECPLLSFPLLSVFRAINPKALIHRVAAIKVVSYATPSSQSVRPQHPPDRQALRKEVQIHGVLKHPNVLEFLGVEEHLKESSKNYVPGLYMVLELGAGGDLFDKIGKPCDS